MSETDQQHTSASAIDVRVNHTCQCCRNTMAVSGAMRGFRSDGFAWLAQIGWECPACGAGHSTEITVDFDLLRRSGFHSWTGEVGDDSVCIVFDGGNVVEDEG